MRLALASPVPLLEGGWLAISIVDLKSLRFRLQAPEVVPMASMTGGTPPWQSRATTKSLRAINAYLQATRERPRPPTRRPPEQ